MIRFIFIIIWLYAMWWSLPALIITFPLLAIGILVIAVLIDHEATRLAKVEADIARRNEEQAQQRAEREAAAQRMRDYWQAWRKGLVPRPRDSREAQDLADAYAGTKR